MAFLFGIPKKLIQRIKEIEIDTHYYDKDVVPSAQNIFTFTVNEQNKTAVITGLIRDDYAKIVIPYKIQYDQTSEALMADVVELSENCFSNYSTLKNVTIPNTIHIIPKNCFINCSSLESVNIPSSVYTIKSKAFNNCDKLNCVLIPFGVNTIEPGAFLNCDNLKIICYKHSEAEKYAIANNIPYSLISYTLDEDITENSENLVTSGIIWKHIKNIITRITNHINNKNNPHDDSTFNNSKLLGDTTIDSVSINAGSVSNILDANESLINKKYVDDIKNITDETIETIDNKYGDITNTLHENVINIDEKFTIDIENIETSIDEIDKDIINIETNINDINLNANKLKNDLTNHIDNKNNPHDDSTFNNSSLTGITNIAQGNVVNIDDDNDVSIVNVAYVKEAIKNSNNSSNEQLTVDLSAYQKLSDTNLETDKKSIVGAINEIYDRVNTVNGDLTRGWNNISLNKLYPISWKFLNKPYCYTTDGFGVDFRIKNLEPSTTNIIDNCNTFDIYVPVDCKYTLSTTSSNDISGYPIDYLVIKYYYTGYDGKDLDTVTEICNSNWPSNIRRTIGYGHQPDNPIITSINGVNTELIKFSGDNTNGGDSTGDTRFYESVYFNIRAIQSILPDDDIEITLYGSWYNSIGKGHINVDLECFANETTPNVIDMGDKFEVRVNNELLDVTYKTNANMSCYVTSFSNKDRNWAAEYQTKYTPVFNMVFHKVTNNSNYRTISITALS